MPTVELIKAGLLVTQLLLTSSVSLRRRAMALRDLADAIDEAEAAERPFGPADLQAFVDKRKAEVDEFLAK